MTLLVRDEEDILTHHIRYHLSKGVDFFIVTDNRSVDGTTELLLDLQSKGKLLYIREDADDYSQSVWVTRMARLAKQKFDAEWVLHSDADEFWWLPEGQTFRTYFDALADDVDGVVANRSNFVVQSDFDLNRPFFEQLVVRERVSQNLFGRSLPPKVCHRGFSDIEVAQGNHSYSLPEREPRNVDCDDLLIFHFPYRGYNHLENKIRLGGAAYERNMDLPKSQGDAWRFQYELLKKGELKSFYADQELSSTEIQEGITSGELIRDTRLRHYFRQLSTIENDSNL